MADLGTDLFLAFNKLKLTPRYISEKRALKRTLKKYSKRKYKYLITGHSLGANLSEALSRRFNLPAQVYNPGRSIGQFKQGLRDRVACKIRPGGERCRDAERIQVFRTKKDPISFLNAHKNTTIVRQKEGVSSHGIANFTSS